MLGPKGAAAPTPPGGSWMQRLVSRLAVAALCTALAGEVEAGTLVTPALAIHNGLNQRVACTVVNGGKKEIGPFTISILRSNGALADQTTIDSLSPGATTFLVADESEIGTTSTAACIVDGKGISKKKTPASLCVVPQTTFDCQAAVQAP